MRLFLVRHGETEYNRRGLALGRDDVPLNERGVWQARRTGEALADEPLTAVYSSPLKRALATAEQVAAPHGLEVRVEERLIEMEIGEAEGLTFAEVRERHPGLLEAWTGPDGPSQPMPGGERLLDVDERAWGAVADLAAAHAGDTLALVAHNFVILCILTRALGLPLAEFRQLRHSVGAIAELEFRPESIAAVRLNDMSHLQEG
jgi:broad specificity phosphatase PhoE